MSKRLSLIPPGLQFFDSGNIRPEQYLLQANRRSDALRLPGIAETIRLRVSKPQAITQGFGRSRDSRACGQRDGDVILGNTTLTESVDRRWLTWGRAVKGGSGTGRNLVGNGDYLF